LRREAVVLASAPAAAAAIAPAPRVSQRWALVGDGPLSHVLAGALAEAGDAVTRVGVGDRGAVNAAVTSDNPAGVVVVIEATEPDADGSPEAIYRRHEDRTATVLAAVQGVLDSPAVRPIWFVTRGAQAVGVHPVLDPEAATVWGISHVVELEHPELRCRRIDVGAQPMADVASRIVAELHDPDPNEPQIAWRGDDRFVRRLALASAPAGTLALDPDASYLVSGGLRGLGLLVAGWMVDHGARSIVLFGRHAPDDIASAAIDGWRARGVVVVVEEADAAVDDDMRRVVARANSLAPLRGVVHGAGALADAALIRQDWPHFASVYGAKVFGTAALLRHLDGHRLDFLALFSSGAGVGGSMGQANHAAANAYLDAVAHDLRGHGVAAVSFDWGAWTRIGAAADRGIDGAPGAFTPEQGLATLERVLAAVARQDGPTQVLVHSSDWSAITSRFPLGGEPSLYRDLFAAMRAAAPPDAARPSAVATTSLREELLALPERRRRVALRDEVRRLAGRVLDAEDVEQIELGQPLHDLGLDSLMAVELRNLLGVAIEAELPATLLFEHPSVNALVDYLLAEHLVGPAPAVDAVPDAVPVAPPVPTAPVGAAAPVGEPANGDVDDIANLLAARLDRLSGR
jgi:acyl carrier protein